MCTTCSSHIKQHNDKSMKPLVSACLPNYIAKMTEEKRDAN